MVWNRSDTFAEEVALTLLSDVGAHFLVCAVKTVLIDNHGLEFFPLLPGFFTDIFKDAFSELTWHGSEVKAVGFFFEFDAENFSCHGSLQSFFSRHYRGQTAANALKSARNIKGRTSKKNTVL